MAPAAAASSPTHQSPTACTCRGAGPWIRNQDQPGGLGVSFVDEVVADVAANEGDVEQDQVVPGEDDRGVVAELAGLSAVPEQWTQRCETAGGVAANRETWKGWPSLVWLRARVAALTRSEM